MERKKLPTFVCIPLLTLSLSGLAGEQVNESRPALQESFVTIINTRGELNIVGWNENEVSIEGELDDLADKLIFEIDGNRVLIEVKLPRSNISWGDGSNLEISIPRNSRLSVTGISADIDVSQIEGGVRIKSVSGELVLNESKERSFLSTVSGDITVGDTTGVLKVNSVSGDIEVDNHQGSIDVESVSGEIDAEVGQSKSIQAGSISGEIAIDASLEDDAYVEMKSVSGSLSLNLNGNRDLNVEMKVNASGDIVNHISDAEASKKHGRKRLSFIVGSGSSDVTMRAVSGDLRIE
jgi:hypothetical protein|tara:strand:- start:811 stop:1692 length:882 start_codon:yes stop_codon:yes gene_type:complete